jgi:SNF2 family DNA or RNA helicase
MLKITNKYIEYKGRDAKSIPYGYVNTFNYEQRNTAQMPLTPLTIKKLQKDKPKLVTETLLNWYRDECQKRKVFQTLHDITLDYFRYDDLYEYQKDFIHYAYGNYLYHNRQIKLLLGDDPRLGKSPQALSIIDLVSKEYDHHPPVLILCPKSLRYQWEKYVYDWTEKMMPLVLDGSTEDKIEQLETCN